MGMPCVCIYIERGIGIRLGTYIYKYIYVFVQSSVHIVVFNDTLQLLLMSLVPHVACWLILRGDFLCGG